MWQRLQCTTLSEGVYYCLSEGDEAPPFAVIPKEPCDEPPLHALVISLACAF